MRSSLLALAVLAALAAPVLAADPYTLEDFLETPYLTSVAVSPDGEHVAWIRTARDLDDDERERELWLADADGENPRRLTWEDEATGGLRWRPDGSLSFLRADDDGHAQVWINPLDGSEPRPVTDFEPGIQGYWWSPDGTWVAALAPRGEDGDTDDDAAGDDEDVDEADPERADWIVHDRLEQPDDYPQLWLVPAGRETEPGDEDDQDEGDEREARRLSEPPQHVYHVAWSPDGRTLAVTYNPLFSSLVDEEQRVALVDLESGEWRDVSDPDRHSSLAAWLPHGRKVAFYTDREDDYRAYLNLKDVVLYEVATGEVEVLTAGTEMALGGTGSTPHRAPIVAEDGRSMYLTAADGITHDIYRLRHDQQGIERVTALEGNVASWDLAGGTLAYVETALHRPGTLYARPAERDRPRELASVDDAVARFELAPARHVRLPGTGGVTVEGFLFLPPGQGDQDELPAVIEMHGGPYYRYGNAWTTRYPWQVLSHEGLAVLIVNPRGGTGYGEEFLRGVYRNFGTDDFRDIMSAVDAMVERGTFDGDRLGFTGYSYGGLMTNVVVSRTPRFRCAVSIAGIWNYTSAIGQNNPQLFIDSYRQPWAGDLQRMWEHSPAARADRITTPTLVMHGIEDEPVDPRQSIEMFSYLQLNGVPSRLVLYPDEGHGINRPSHMLDYQTRELEWFRHYLLGDEDAAGAEPPLP
ncbi:prolyl oligopeptidase family serine peptidase, partial [bacterium]|nr:prolyl oligopeptidase family serine peptidase [bacterium]